MSLPDEPFVPLLGQDRNDGLAPLMNIGVGHDLTIRELAETMKSVVGYQGAIEFNATKPDGTPRKLMDVGRLNAIGWQAATPMQTGLDFRRIGDHGNRVVVISRLSQTDEEVVRGFRGLQAQSGPCRWGPR